MNVNLQQTHTHDMTTLINTMTPQLRFAANLSLLYQDVPLLERPALAARDGFAGVEIQFPYEVAAEDFKAALDQAGLPLIVHNTPKGGAADFGLAAVPGREAQFREDLERALAYSHILGNRLLHVMAGRVPADSDPARVRETFTRNLQYACTRAAQYELTVLIEPINTRDVPDYWLNYQAQAVGLIDAVAAPNLKLLMDFYHLQIMEGDLLAHFQRYATYIAHVQIAGVPDRGEPDRGEVNYPFLFAALQQAGYQGWIGAEYRPRGGNQPGATSAGLGWLRQRLG